VSGPSARVMGILNVTPDSFSDGGEFLDPEAAIGHAIAMVADGADIIDVGGESTRPGADGVSADEELERIIPVIEGIRARVDTLICVDTSKPQVMREAVVAGAGMINDVRALRTTGALEAVAALDVPVCLMHMRGEPRTMQASPMYDDVVREVRGFLEQRARACEAMGMAPTPIVIDPGFGFGKTLDHNLALMACLESFVESGRQVMIGVSRKSMIGALLDRGTADRVHGSVGLAVLAAVKGASIVRVHDVRPTVDALRVVGAVTAHAGDGSATTLSRGH